MNFNIAYPFYLNTISHPDKLAVSAGGTDLSYAELARVVRKVSSELHKIKGGKIGRVGVLASRSIGACVGVLATAWAGGTYVPLGLNLPEERLIALLSLAKIDALITDEKGAAHLSEAVLSVCPSLILVPRAENIKTSPRKASRALSIADLPEGDNSSEPEIVDARHSGYIQFTSGTTGVPKGVIISAGALHHYLGVMQGQYVIATNDRIAEPCELNFDLSVGNMFMAWKGGASLHIIAPEHMTGAAQFIQDKRLTIFYFVPSIIAFMKQTKTLRAGGFPSLRYSLFIGEALPASSALAWKDAASNSIVENLYGPTEATVACLRQLLTDPPPITPQRDMIAIGSPFPGMEAAIVSADVKFLPRGEEGELALAGPQLADGYFEEEAMTRARFPIIDGKRWYLTGDLAVQDAEGRYHHLGRVDNQVKVLGKRIELEEIETHIRAVSKAEFAATVTWPMVDGAARGIVGFVTPGPVSVNQIKLALKERLPPHMIPQMIYEMKELPHTANGKIDRKALRAMLDEKKI